MPRVRKPASPNNNRTDLNVPRIVEAAGQPNGAPNVQATGLPYGEALALHRMQSAVPITNPALPTASAAAPVSDPGAATGGPPDISQAMADLQGHQMPSNLLGGPSGRPDEPITAGMAEGPGAGPEVLNGISAPQSQVPNAVATLQRLAAMPTASPDIKQLAAFAQQAMAGHSA